MTFRSKSNEERETLGNILRRIFRKRGSFSLFVLLQYCTILRYVRYIRGACNHRHHIVLALLISRGERISRDPARNVLYHTVCFPAEVGAGREGGREGGKRETSSGACYVRISGLQSAMLMHRVCGGGGEGRRVRDPRCAYSVGDA